MLIRETNSFTMKSKDIKMNLSHQISLKLEFCLP